MADIHTLNTVYRIEKTSPLLAKLEDKGVYSVIFNQVIAPLEEEVQAYREGNSIDMDDTDNATLVKCRRVMSDLKYLRAGKISRDTLDYVRFKSGVYRNRRFDEDKLSADPMGNEVKLHHALCKAFSEFLHGVEE